MYLKGKYRAVLINYPNQAEREALLKKSALVNTATRLCITGGSGFIGTASMQWAMDKSLTVVNFDIRPPNVLAHQKYWKYLDIRDNREFTSALIDFQPTHIWHLAALTGMDIHDMSFFDANTIGVKPT